MAETAREPLLLLPGLLCDQGVWRSQLKDLSDVFECTVAKLDAQDTIGSMATDALASVHGTFSLAGHSMGGYVAMEIMRRAPQRVRRLALLDTQPRADTTEQAHRRQEFIEEAQRGGFTQVVAGFPPLLFFESRLSDHALVDSFRVMAQRVGLEAFLRQQRAIIRRRDSMAVLKTVSCPTLVLCGRQDLITPVANSELMGETIPGANLVIVTDCGHMAPMEKPVEVNHALRVWLREPLASVRGRP